MRQEYLKTKNGYEVLERTDNCILLGRISDQKLLSAFYSMADVFVICSKRENFPTTCVEAQCCGTPVAGFDTGGTKETDISGEKCFVKYPNLRMLRKVIQRILQTSNLQELSQKAEKVYKRQSMCDAYMDIYRKSV